jgi:hypothetical protein
MTDNTMAKRKRTNNSLQNITHKTKERATQTSLKTGDELVWSRWVSNSCSTGVTNVKSLLHVVGMLLDAYLKEEPPNDHSISFCFKFALWSPNDHSISFCFKFVLWFPRRIFYMKFCQNKPNLCICKNFVGMKLQV